MWLHVLVLAPLRSFVQSKVRRYRPLIICLTRSNMPLNPEISRFIREHLDDNPDQLLWKKNEYPDDRVVVAVEQIQARENIKEKLPSWYACQNIFYPSKLSTEQCSSETTAPYKARLTTGNSLCDLTGGLGLSLIHI